MPIESFSGEFRWLSNFSPSPIRFLVVGQNSREVIIFPTVEHGFVWHKTTSNHWRRLVLEQTTPGKVKRLGRKLELREDWESIKLPIMRLLVWLKFSQHDDLRELLLSTGEQELIEGNHWGDTFWGVCNGEGQNHLGRILMDVRSTLREIHGN